MALCRYYCGTDSDESKQNGLAGFEHRNIIDKPLTLGFLPSSRTNDSWVASETSLIYGTPGASDIPS
jgi:hypothetical protein